LQKADGRCVAYRSSVGRRHERSKPGWHDEQGTVREARYRTNSSGRVSGPQEQTSLESLTYIIDVHAALSGRLLGDEK
jgi:hypothetical protein